LMSGTATAHATGEYTAACRRNGNTVMIGWVRF